MKKEQMKYFFVDGEGGIVSQDGEALVYKSDEDVARCIGTIILREIKIMSMELAEKKIPTYSATIEYVIKPSKVNPFE